MAGNDEVYYLQRIDTQLRGQPTPREIHLNETLGKFPERFNQYFMILLSIFSVVIVTVAFGTDNDSLSIELLGMTIPVLVALLIAAVSGIYIIFHLRALMHGIRHIITDLKIFSPEDFNSLDAQNAESAGALVQRKRLAIENVATYLSASPGLFSPFFGTPFYRMKKVVAKKEDPSDLKVETRISLWDRCRYSFRIISVIAVLAASCGLFLGSIESIKAHLTHQTTNTGQTQAIAKTAALGEGLQAGRDRTPAMSTATQTDIHLNDHPAKIVFDGCEGCDPGGYTVNENEEVPKITDEHPADNEAAVPKKDEQTKIDGAGEAKAVANSITIILKCGGTCDSQKALPVAKLSVLLTVNEVLMYILTVLGLWLAWSIGNTFYRVYNDFANFAEAELEDGTELLDDDGNTFFQIGPICLKRDKSLGRLTLSVGKADQRRFALFKTAFALLFAVVFGIAFLVSRVWAPSVDRIGEMIRYLSNQLDFALDFLENFLLHLF